MRLALRMLGLRVRSPLVLLIGLVPLGGCGDDPTWPGISARYALQAVDGVAVPAVLYARPEASMTIVADTLVLWRTGWSRLTEYVHRTRPLLEPPVDAVDTSTVTRRYSIRGDSLYFPFRCPPDVLSDCPLPPPRGAFSADRSSLTLRFTLFDLSTQVRDYRRISE